MRKEKLITNYDQLLAFIMENKLNSKQISKLLMESLQILADENKTPAELIKEIKDFIMKYRNRQGEKPIFLGNISLDVEEPKEH